MAGRRPGQSCWSFRILLVPKAPPQQPGFAAAYGENNANPAPEFCPAVGLSPMPSSVQMPGASAAAHRASTTSHRRSDSSAPADERAEQRCHPAKIPQPTASTEVECPLGGQGLGDFLCQCPMVEKVDSENGLILKSVRYVEHDSATSIPGIDPAHLNDFLDILALESISHSKCSHRSPSVRGPSSINDCTRERVHNCGCAAAGVAQRNRGANGTERTTKRPRRFRRCPVALPSRSPAAITKSSGR